MEKLDNQQKIIEKIEKIVTPVVNEMGLSLVDIEYMQDGGYWYVRIYVEFKWRNNFRGVCCY